MWVRVREVNGVEEARKPERAEEEEVVTMEGEMRWEVPDSSLKVRRYSSLLGVGGGGGREGVEEEVEGGGGVGGGRRGGRK